MRRVCVALLIQFLSLALASASAQVLSFESVNVASPAPVQTLTYSFSSAATLSAVNIVTTGASGLDYTDGGSTCTAGTAYNAGDTCTVAVAFTPSAAGLRSGAVMLFSAGSTPPLATFYLNGVGQSGAVTIDPGTQSTLATLSGSGQAYGSAIDGSGNVYVVDHANSLVIELAAGTFAQSTVVSSGLLNPTAVALDGAGNLYISDTGNGRVAMVPNEQGTLNAADMSTVNGASLVSPRGIALDGSGDLYVADSGNGAVIEIPSGGGMPVTVASGLTSVHGVAVDAGSNVYVATNNSVSEYQPPFIAGTAIPMGGGYSSPRGVAVDASGEVYVADSGNAQIVIVAPGGASQATLAVAGISNPQGVAADSSGNVYVTDTGNVYELNRSQAAALAFANAYVGSNSAPQTVTVSDVGNMSLSISGLAITANFTQIPSGGADCTASTQLSSAGQCLIAVASAPTFSGLLTGALTLTNNSLNNPSSTQTVQLSGTGLQVAQTITFPTISTQVFGVAPFALGATSNSGLPVSYSVSSGPATVLGNLLTITGAGSVMVLASQSGNARFAPGTSVSQTFTVNPAATSVVWSNPAAIGYGTPLSAIQLDATATPVGGGTYVYNPPAGTVLNLGSQTLSVQFTPTSSNYAPSTGSATLQVNQGSQTINFPIIPAQMYGAGQLTLSATASSGLPVSYKVTSGPATVSGSTLTITGTGSVTVQASQTGSAQYTAATPVAQTFAVNPEATTVTWSNPAAITYGTALSAKQLNATATPVSTGTYAYTPASGTVLNAGTQTLSVQFTPNKSLYATSTGSATLQVNQASQKITFTQKAPTSAQYGSSFTVVATAGSGSAVVFTSSGVCTNAGATFTMGNSAGTCTVIANQSGNGNYLAAPTATETTNTSGKISQTVTFTGAPASAPYQSSFAVAASSNSGITPTITATGPCSISGNTVTMTGGNGTCMMTATWPTNSIYVAATATQTTTAAKIAPTVSFTGAPATAQYQTTFPVVVTANSGITPTITAAGSCSISSGIVTIKTSSGTCTLKAAWAVSNNYLAASLTQTTTAQKQATIITWPQPSPIDDHTPLDETELDAVAGVSGTFSYTPKAGKVLSAGLQTLSVKFTPSSSNYTTVTATVTLQVTTHVCVPGNQSGALGPPNYGGLRNDPCPVTVGNIPSLWTNFAKDYGYSGAGTVITNAMGLKVLRVTDGNTDPSYPGKAYMNAYSGGDGDQLWAIDHSMFVLGRGGVQGQAAAFTYVYLFNGAPMQATQLQNAGKPFLLPSTLVAFGQTPADARKIFVLGNSSNCTKTGPCALLQYDLSSCMASPTNCSPPTPTTIYDFQQPASGNSPANCLSGLNVTWYGDFRVSNDDTLFMMGFSNSGTQSSGTIVAGYPVGNGCRVWNTGTTTLNVGPTAGGIPGGYVVGEFPPGAATPQPMTMTGCGTGYNCPGGPDQFTLHGVNSVPSSLLGHVSSSICLAGSCCGISGGLCNSNPNPNGEYFWEFATTNAFAFGGSGSQFSGHECIGYSSLVHSKAQDQMGFIGLMSPGGVFTPSIVSTGGNDALLVASGNLPVTGSLNLDTHCGWNADNLADTMPILVSTTTVCLGNQGQLHNACTPPSNLPNNGCVIPADITNSNWPTSGPNCGTVNAFTGPLVNEVLLYQTNNNPGASVNACVTTNGSTNSYENGGAPPCSQSNILRLGNHGVSAMNPNFNAQNATINWSPDGLFYTVTTDWWCTFGAAVLGQDTICGGVEWQQNTAYSVGDVITPTAGNTSNCTYTASGTPPLVSGTTEPTGWSALVGGVCPAQIPATGTDGNIVWLRVGAIGMQNARYDVIVGSTTPN
jgi:hypothetical protein